MSKKPAFLGTLMRIVPVSLAAGLVFATAPAHAGYGGHYGGYGGHYGGYGGHYYGGYRSGHYGSRYGGYGGHYYGGHHYGGYRGSHYGGYRGYGGADYYGGYPYYGYSRGRAYGGGSFPVRASTSPGSIYSGDSGPASRSNGWARLAAGEYSAALSDFAAEATRHPSVGKSKVGYALASAAAGDLRRGVWAMRRAFRIDPDSMHYLTIDDSLRPRIEQLIARYQTYPDRTLGNADEAFMLASLHYLLGDARTARRQVKLGVAAGDRSSSTANLERLIDNELAGTSERDTEN